MSGSAPDYLGREVPDLDQYDKWAEKARDIFKERNIGRQSAFKNAGWKGNLVECHKKLDRLWAMWADGRSPEDKDYDEAVDLINAVIFTLICMDEGTPDGFWNWP